MSAQVSPEDIREAQDRLLEARASWMLRNDVVESAMMVNPIIKAVHRGTDASPIERYVERPAESARHADRLTSRHHAVISYRT